MRTGVVFLIASLAAIQLSAQQPQLLKDISPGKEHGLFLVPDAGFGSRTAAVVLGSKMYFPASDAVGNTELWSTDGTVAGTVKIAEIHPGGASYPQNLFAFRDHIYFSADNGTDIGSELFISDGTETGTALLQDVVPGAAGSNARNFYIYNDALYFEAFYYTEDPATRLHQSDGTTEGTDSVHFPMIGHGIYHTGADFQAPPVIIRGNALIGNAYNGALGYTDLAAGQTTIVGDGLYANMRGFTELVPDSVFVFLSDSGSSALLWRSDGTAAGTYSIGTLECLHGNPLRKYNNALYYWVYGCLAPDNEGLWKTDGTIAGTVLVKPAASPNVHYDKAPIVLFNGLMYFVGRDSTGQTALWHSDGTADNTRPFFTFDRYLNDAISASLSDAVIFNNRLYFTAYDQQTGWEVWSTDGTAAGTALLHDLNPGSAGSIGDFYSAAFCEYDGKLFFQADNGTSGREWFYIGKVPSSVGEPELPEMPASILYPNPSGDGIRISDTGMDIAKLTIVNSIGEEVYTDTAYEAGKTIDIRALPGGVYMVRLELRSGAQLITKLIRQ